MPSRLNHGLFSVNCDAGGSGGLQTGSDHLSIKVGQTIFRNGLQEMWDFVLVLAQEGTDGELKTQILLCHPDWDDPVELACIESSREGVTVGLTHDSSQPP